MHEARKYVGISWNSNPKLPCENKCDLNTRPQKAFLKNRRPVQYWSEQGMYFTIMSYKIDCYFCSQKSLTINCYAKKTLEKWAYLAGRHQASPFFSKLGKTFFYCLADVAKCVINFKILRINQENNYENFWNSLPFRKKIHPT